MDRADTLSTTSFHQDTYCASAPVPWSAVSERVRVPYDEQSEVQVLNPEEIQLFGAVALSVRDPFQYGQLRPYSFDYPIRVEVPVDRLDLRSPKVRQFLNDRVAAEMEHFVQNNNADPHERFWEWDSECGNPRETIELIRAINPRDRLLIRGLSKFLTARALSCQRGFLEEAGIAAFISLEAALTIVRQHLEFIRGHQASFDDAYDHLRLTFPTGEPLAEWLRELYDLRVIAVHPSSRFGEFWSPPMTVEHCFEAIGWLIPLYRYVLLSEVPVESAA